MKKQTVIGIMVVLIILNVFLIVALINSNESKEYQQLIDDYESLTQDHKALTEKANGIVQEDNSFIQGYGGMKYPVTSGLRNYIGEEPLRVYPSSKAPYIYEDYGQYVYEDDKPNLIVELINEVQTEKETWCLVLDSRGISGYAHRSDLITIDEEENSYDYGSGIETLGGFTVGERIETLIGMLDRDYYLIYENGRIYEFPDKASKDISVDPIKVPFSDIRSLDAFVRDTNRISLLRTDSPEFPLKDGYKVGDNAIEVLDFYASKYDYLDDSSHYWYSDYTFILEDGHMMEFFIDTEELNQSSVIRSIWID